MAWASFIWKIAREHSSHDEGRGKVLENSDNLIMLRNTDKPTLSGF